jgi:hypothetical protein
MCLIIDANCAYETLSVKPSPVFSPVIQAIQQKKAVMVIGGKKLREEYLRLPTVWRFILMLDRAGKAVAYSDAAIDKLERSLEESGLLHSDDPHIIALAKVSGARLLCSKDVNLHKDFRSAKLISKPRGAIYQKESHIKLIGKLCRH